MSRSIYLPLALVLLALPCAVCALMPLAAEAAVASLAQRRCAGWSKRQKRSRRRSILASARISACPAKAFAAGRRAPAQASAARTMSFTSRRAVACGLVSSRSLRSRPKRSRPISVSWKRFAAAAAIAPASSTIQRPKTPPVPWRWSKTPISSASRTSSRSTNPHPPTRPTRRPNQKPKSRAAASSSDYSSGNSRGCRGSGSPGSGRDRAAPAGLIPATNTDSRAAGRARTRFGIVGRRCPCFGARRRRCFAWRRYS